MAITFATLMWSLIGVVIAGVFGWIVTEKAWVSITLQMIVVGVALLLAGG